MKPRQPLTLENALSRAAALCARCEQCTPDLIKKLTAWGLTQTDVKKVIAELERLRFVDDSRFAKAYAHDKLHFSGWGRRKITQGLWAKRLQRDIIDEACDDFEEEEYHDIVLKVIANKACALKEEPHSYEWRAKLFRFGVMRGFESSLVSEIIKHEIRKDDADEE